MIFIQDIQELHINLPQNLEDIKLPAPELVNYWRLAENRIFYIANNFSLKVYKNRL